MISQARSAHTIAVCLVADDIFATVDLRIIILATWACHLMYVYSLIRCCAAELLMDLGCRVFHCFSYVHAGPSCLMLFLHIVNQIRCPNHVNWVDRQGNCSLWQILTGPIVKESYRNA
jgi:hypothetical protein